MNLIRLFSLVNLIALGGCAVIGPSFPSTINKELRGSAPSCADMEWVWGESGEVVVILSLSGGGKRAAAFAYGAMLGLEEINLELQNGQEANLLRQVDFISAVSGGATLGAFYALHKGDAGTFHTFPDFLNEDTELFLTLRSFYPWNWFNSLAVVQGDYFGNTLYDNKTFADLPKWPLLTVSATDLTKGEQFNFSRSQFRCIGSDLEQYPLGQAVAASAAFPLYFGAVPLRNYNFPPDAYSIALNRHKGRIVNLSDGGLVDNLAIKTYRQLLTKGYLVGNRQGTSRKLAKALVFIRIDGSAHLGIQFDESSVSPGLLSRVERSFDVVFEQQVEDSLEKLREEFTSYLDESGVPYFLLKVALRDAPEDVKQRVLKVPTRWTLGADDVEVLIKAGRDIVRSKVKAIKAIQELFVSIIN